MEGFGSSRALKDLIQNLKSFANFNSRFNLNSKWKQKIDLTLGSLETSRLWVSSNLNLDLSISRCCTTLRNHEWIYRLNPNQLKLLQSSHISLFSISLSSLLVPLCRSTQSLFVTNVTQSTDQRKLYVKRERLPKHKQKNRKFQNFCSKTIRSFYVFNHHQFSITLFVILASPSSFVFFARHDQKLKNMHSKNL